jgi:hypothetical protein
MHVLAAKAAYFAVMGASDPAAAPPAASAPPAAPPAAAAPPVASPSAPPAPPPAMKAEVKDEAANGGQTELGKSEKDIQIEALQKKVDELEGTVPALVAVLQKIASVPARKGVTSAAQLNKSVGELTKSEITNRLNRLVKSNISDSDRDAIKSYTYGRVGVEGIKHLLENK